MPKVSKSDFPPASPDTVVHLEALGFALSLTLPRLPALRARSSERLEELKRAL